MNLFINTCAHCNKRVLSSKSIFCLECSGLLPRTYFNFSDNNIVLDRLRPFIKLSGAGSYLFYNHHSMVQQILWEIKYNNNKSLSTEMGRLAAADLNPAVRERFDFVLPIPLHPSKLLIRGYNQVEYFGHGLCEFLQLPLETKLIRRKKKTSSQTKLNRLDRFQNLEDSFEIQNKDGVQGKRILLIDDVVTTGATIVSAANILWKEGCADLGVYTLASAFEL